MMQKDGIAAENNTPWSGKDGFMYSAQLHAQESEVINFLSIYCIRIYKYLIGFIITFND